jgi:hypothetical protein
MKALKMLWALPNTVVGVVLGFLSWAWPRWDDRGVLLFEGDRGFRKWHSQKGYVAITFGHAVVAKPQPGEKLMRHELAHVAQYEKWGPFYMLAYAFYWVRLRLAGKDPYHDNPFEREAREAEELPA